MFSLLSTFVPLCSDDVLRIFNRVSFIPLIPQEVINMQRIRLRRCRQHFAPPLGAEP